MIHVTLDLPTIKSVAVHWVGCLRTVAKSVKKALLSINIYCSVIKTSSIPNTERATDTSVFNARRQLRLLFLQGPT